MRRVSVVVILLWTLIGCQSNPNKDSDTANQQKEPPVTPKQRVKRGFQYDPGTNEEFRLKALSVGQQKSGIKQFCVDSKTTLCEPLSYTKYKGMKGYFLSMEPVRIDDSLYAFRKVVLQNGQRFFYVSNKNYGGIYAKDSPISRISTLDEPGNHIGKPISATSTIVVTGVAEREGESYFTLSNGAQIKQKQFTLFSKVIAAISNQQQLDELTHLLAGLELKHDIAKDRLIIHSREGNNAPLRTYIVKRHNITSLRLRHQYIADKWLSVRSFILIADKVQYRSHRVSFEKKERNSSKIEWYDIAPEQDYIKVLKAAALAHKVTLRFYSNDYYVDRDFPTSSKTELTKILRTYALLKEESH